MSDKYTLDCPTCSAAYGPKSGMMTCEKCGAPTVVAIDTSRIPAFKPSADRSMWRYFDLLPLANRSAIISQGEGLTPLIDSPGLAEMLGIRALQLKNETVNPTGSFKDRQISVGISKAREAGAHTLAVVSSGNVAASSASYCAIAGMKCNIFTPCNAPEEKLVQARMYGASFFKVNTLSSSRIFELIMKVCDERDWHLLSTAGLYNPYQVEGGKTIAHELSEFSSALPDWIIAPVGGGGLVGSLWRGFRELKALGVIEKLPAIVGVQSSACTPLVNAIENNLSPAEVVANPVSVGDTIAGAIADDILFDAYTALPAIRETGGTAISVTDEEMLQAEKQLARRAGIFAEPASSSTIAGAKKLRESGVIGEDDTVCCIITGSGFKDMASARKLVEPPVEVEPTVEAFMKLPAN
jgi:threonine synthase